MKRWAVVLALLVGFGVAATSRPTAQSGAQDPPILAKIRQINRQLASSGLNIAVEQVEFFTFGSGRPSFRIHQQPFRWVANDPRRLADGDNITYLVDQSDGKTASGLTSAQTEFAIDRGMDTWQAQEPLRSVDLVKRGDTGEDPDIYDSFFGFGKMGNPFLADIVNAGWLPRAFFEEAGGPWWREGNPGVLRHVLFTEDDGTPTDINGDNYLDSALNEVYYNDTFGKKQRLSRESLGHRYPVAGHRRRDCGAARERPLARSGALRSAARRSDEPGLCRHPARPVRD